MESRPLPLLCDFAHVGVLCTFSNILAAAIAGFARSYYRPGRRYILSGWQAVWPTHHSTNHHFPVPLLQLPSAGRRVGSIFYGLRPLWVVRQAGEIREASLHPSPPHTLRSQTTCFPLLVATFHPYVRNVELTQYVLYVLHDIKFPWRSMRTLFFFHVDRTLWMPSPTVPILKWICWHASPIFWVSFYTVGGYSYIATATYWVSFPQMNLLTLHHRHGWVSISGSADLHLGWSRNYETS